MYYIKFEQELDFEGVWARNKRKKESFNDYRTYLEKKILNKIAKVLVKKEEEEELCYFSADEYQKKLKKYKSKYEDVAKVYANITLGERYPESLLVDDKEIEHSNKKRLSFKNALKSFKKKFSKKRKKGNISVHDELLENYSLAESDIERSKENRSLHDEIIENFSYKEDDSIHDETAKDLKLAYSKGILDYNQTHEGDNLDVKSAFKYSAKAIPCILTQKEASFYSAKNAFNVDLDSVSYPLRQIDCGNGMIEIFGDEFRMLIESKYNAMKENENAFHTLPQIYRKNFDAYYEEQVSNAFDYSKNGKVTLSKTEYEKLLKIHEDYTKLCIIRKKRKQLQKRKDKYIEEIVEMAIQEAENKFQQKEEKLNEAETKYMASLEKAQQVKVIKK